ncbi:MAG: hypothetical protein KDC54_03655 [Lewinella sp.]|nr:hypothetical protein [Lewinella sp.]
MSRFTIFCLLAVSLGLLFSCQRKNSAGSGRVAAIPTSRSSVTADPDRPRLFQFEEPLETELIRLTPQISIPAEPPGYTLIQPKGETEGVIVFFGSGRDTTHAGYEMRLYETATDQQVALLYVSTGNPLEFLFDSTRYYQLERYIHQAVQEYNLPAHRLLFTGMSLGGTRALKFAEWCMAGHAPHGVRPRAVAICDAPLDFFRFYQQGERAIRMGASPISVNEATWVNYQLQEHLGGTPDEAPRAYRDYSPYVYEVSIFDPLESLRNIAVRAYTEPDVEWWIAQRQKDYYSINAPDAAGLINDLLYLGNNEAELIVTEGKGHHPDGTRHPHSWSIVDNEELVRWFLRLP